MVKEKLQELARRTFWLIAVVLVLSLPMMLVFGPVVERNQSFDGMKATTTGWMAMGGMVAFTLVVAGIFVFWIFPALLELGEAILAARNDPNREMFP